MARIHDVETALAERPERWLVTGGAGFIGSHLVDALLGLGQQVTVIDDLSTGNLDHLVSARAHPAFRWIEGDVCDPAALDSALQGVDRVLHQAALGSVPRSIAAPEPSQRANVEGFFQLLEAVRRKPVRGLVYASSSSVLGDTAPIPAPDDAPLNPISPYAATKASNEMMAGAWSAAYGIPVIGLRYFNVVGPRQRVDGQWPAVVPTWVQALTRGERPLVFGTGLIARDFCPVANVVQANLLAAVEAERCSGRVFNVGLGQQTTLLQLLDGVRRRVQLRVDCADLEPLHRPARAGDIRRTQADLSGIRGELGYAPVVELADGLEEAVDGCMDALGVPAGRR